MGLPNLVRIFVLVQLQKFLVGVQSGLRLLQLIVAECANEPSAGRWLFELGNDVEDGKRAGIISGQVVGGAEVFPIRDVPLVELDGGSEFDFSVLEIAELKIDAAKPAAKLCILRSEGDSALQSESSGIPLLLADLDIGAKLERIKGWRDARLFGAEESFGGIELIFCDERAGESFLGGGIVGLRF